MELFVCANSSKRVCAISALPGLSDRGAAKQLA